METHTATAAVTILNEGATSALLQSITRYALDPWTLFVAGLVYLLLRFAVRITHASESERAVAIVRRALPFLPEVLGVGIAVAGGVPTVATQPFIMRAAVGLWAAYVATKLHKILGQTVLGDDGRLERSIARRLNGRREVDHGDDKAA